MCSRVTAPDSERWRRPDRRDDQPHPAGERPRPRRRPARSRLDLAVLIDDSPTARNRAGRSKRVSRLSQRIPNANSTATSANTSWPVTRVVGVEEVRATAEDDDPADDHGAEADDEAGLATLPGPIGLDPQTHRRPLTDRHRQLATATRWCATTGTSPTTAPRRQDRPTGRRPRRRTRAPPPPGDCRPSRAARRSTSGRIASGQVRAVATIVPMIPCSADSRSRSCSHHAANASIRACSAFAPPRRRGAATPAPRRNRPTAPATAGDHPAGQRQRHQRRPRRRQPAGRVNACPVTRRAATRSGGGDVPTRADSITNPPTQPPRRPTRPAARITAPSPFTATAPNPDSLQSHPARAIRSRRGDDNAWRGTSVPLRVEAPQLGRRHPALLQAGDLDDRRAVAAHATRRRLVTGEMDDDRRRLGQPVVDRLHRHRRMRRQPVLLEAAHRPTRRAGMDRARPTPASTRRTRRAPGRPRRRGSRRRSPGSGSTAASPDGSDRRPSPRPHPPPTAAANTAPPCSAAGRRDANRAR